MGYTHYWRKGTSMKGWDRAHCAAQLLLADRGAVHTDWFNSPEAGVRTINSDIHFNGHGDLAHETFFMPCDWMDLQDFQFCKTAEKPYDVMVVAILCIFGHYAPDALHITSDGEHDEWLKGAALATEFCNEVIGVPRLVY